MREVVAAGRRVGLAPLALLLVGRVDRRLVAGLSLVPQLLGFEARALHVSTDAEEAHEVARRWLDLGIDWLPLDIEDAGGSLVGAVRRVVGERAEARPRTIVVVPELDLGRWWHPVLHRGMGRRMARALSDVPGVTTVVVPTCVG